MPGLGPVLTLALALALVLALASALVVLGNISIQAPVAMVTTTLPPHVPPCT